MQDDFLRIGVAMMPITTKHCSPWLQVELSGLDALDEGFPFINSEAENNHVTKFGLADTDRVLFT